MNKKRFSPNDQSAFAKLSGDYNPIHIDEVAARRLLFGAPVVHGVHALLWCLDAIFQDRGEEKLELLEVKAIFLKPITVGEEVGIETIAGHSPEAKEWNVKAKLIVKESVVVLITAKFRHLTVTAAGQSQPKLSFPEELQSRTIERGQMASSIGSLSLHLQTSAAAELFPALTVRLPLMQISVVLAATKVIGVHCPGLNSLFSELTLNKVENTADHLQYRVSHFDERFDLAVIDILAPQITGQLRAFLRPPPCQQPAYAEFLRHVGPLEFAECRVLLIGGSRGLGEVAAKIFSAGGADVRFTYCSGGQDAAKVVEDITASGGKASAFQFDISNAELPDDVFSGGAWIPTHALYFATPRILSGTRGVFSANLFNGFCDYFVIAFSRIFTQLNTLGTNRFFLPSSCLIDEMSPHMAEYVVAKAAAEHAARILEITHRDVIITQPRLPRLATDQTATISISEEGDPLPVMLNELRSFAATNR